MSSLGFRYEIDRETEVLGRNCNRNNSRSLILSVHSSMYLKQIGHGKRMMCQ
eukprot:UN12327